MQQVQIDELATFEKAILRFFLCQMWREDYDGQQGIYAAVATALVERHTKCFIPL